MAQQNNTVIEYMNSRVRKEKVLKALCVHEITADVLERKKTGFKKELDEPEQLPTKVMRIEAYERYMDPKLWKELVTDPRGSVRRWVKRRLGTDSLKKVNHVWARTISHGRDRGNQKFMGLFRVNLDFAPNFIKMSREDAIFATPT